MTGANLQHWHDFFVAVCGGSAALAGLVFVAMSLNVAAIADDSTHRYRAIGTLAGFTSAFLISAVALMADQSEQVAGIEWGACAAIAGTVYLYGYVQAVRTGGSRSAMRLDRVVLSMSLYVIQIVGAIFTTCGQPAGLYAASIAMVTMFPLLISGAWLLIVGVHRDQAHGRHNA